MKQIIQNLKNGETILEKVPRPLVKKGCVLIRTERSLVSLGTEKMLIEFGKSNLLAKANQQPEKVKQVVDKIKTEGLFPTLKAVFNKLDEPLPLGYSNAGEIIEIGDGVKDFKIGDRVISNGPHAEFVVVPKNLCAKIPQNVSYDEACFTVIGSIGLQGVRLADPTFGELFVVIGLGLIGLITAQLLQANGCQVIGFDFDQSKIDMAKSLGISAHNSSECDPIKIIDSLTDGIGADGILITASTKSNEVINQSAQMSRKGGRIILVGVVGLDINRSEFFKKEIRFQVSCSYGPGRYDENYEYLGIDYPIAFVRWTENRNFQAILQAISIGQLKVENLITQIVDLENYLDIYNTIGGTSIASIIRYNSSRRNEESKIDHNHPKIPFETASDSRIIKLNEFQYSDKKAVIGVIGSGNFTKMTLLPILKQFKPNLKYISNSGGVSANFLAKKYGFSFVTSDYKNLMSDKDIDLLMITTRHNLHAKMVIEGIESGKNVFVEKPLALTSSELSKIKSAYFSKKNNTLLTVGFNRRFSPYIIKAKKLLGDTNTPINMNATMNAGYIPNDVWVHDMNIGGGRIVGEACHFIDLMLFLCGSKVVSIFASYLGNTFEENTDNVIITLKFENGSQGVINYFSNGSKEYSKERLEIYSQEKTLILDNFKNLSGYSFKGFSKMTGKLDKGHANQFKMLLKSISGDLQPLIPFDELINVTEASLAALQSLKQGKIIHIEQ